MFSSFGLWLMCSLIVMLDNNYLFIIVLLLLISYRGDSLVIIVRDSKSGRIVNVSRDVKPKDIAASRAKRISSGKVVPRNPLPLNVSGSLEGGGSYSVGLGGNVTITDVAGQKTSFKTATKDVLPIVQEQDKSIREQIATRNFQRKLERTAKTLEREAVNKRMAELKRIIKSEGVITSKGKTAARKELETLKRAPASVFRESQKRILDLGDVVRKQKLKDLIRNKNLQALLTAAKPRTRKEKAIGAFLEQQVMLSGKRETALREKAHSKVLFQTLDPGGLNFISGAKLRLQSEVKLALLGVIRSATVLPALALFPKSTSKSFVKAVSIEAPETLKQLSIDFERDPSGTVAEFLAFSKGSSVVGKFARRTPVGQFFAEEAFLRFRVPKNLRPSVRKILKAANAQRKINPSNLKKLSSKDLNVMKPKTLNTVEFKATLKALQSKKIDSVVFGSGASKILSKSKNIHPKDLDIATSSVDKFAREFIRALPKAERANYVLKGEKVFRVGRKTALFDIKPLERLIQDPGFFSKRGVLPVAGVAKKIKLLDTVSKLPKKLSKGVKPSKLPEFKSKVISGSLEGGGALVVQTEKLVSVGGVKFVSFGEQTVRKALGTFQVLIEKNSRRAKDPASLLVDLEIQLQALKASKIIGKVRKVKALQEAIKVLKSKDFAKLLNSKVKGLTNDFPLVAKINKRALKTLNSKKVQQLVKTEKQLALLRNVKASSLPSVLPSKVPSALPSRLSKIPVSRIPSLVPSKPPVSRLSNIPSSKLSGVPVSRLSSIPLSKIPSLVPSKPSVSRLSNIPGSKIGASKIPSSRLSKIGASKIPGLKVPKAPGKSKKFSVFLLKKLSKKKITGSKPQVFAFTPTIRRPKKIDTHLKLFSGAELR